MVYYYKLVRYYGTEQYKPIGYCSTILLTWVPVEYLTYVIQLSLYHFQLSGFGLTSCGTFSVKHTSFQSEYRYGTVQVLVPYVGDINYNIS